MKRTAFILSILLLAQWAISQDQTVLKYANTITQEDLKKHLSIIASDEYEGRNTGEKGLEMAARYLETEFAGDLLTGPYTSLENPFYQEFELERKTWVKNVLNSDKIKLLSGKDYYFAESSPGLNEFDLVFAGYGIYSSNYNDYKDLDVKGKIVAFLLGEPKTKEGIYLMTGTGEPGIKTDTTINGKFEAIQSKAMASMLRGAKGFILIETSDLEAEKTISTLKKYMGSSTMGFPGKGGGMPSFPVILMSPTGAAKLFGQIPKKFQKTVQEKIDQKISPAGMFQTKITIESEQKTEIIKTGNVVATIEGSDKKDEYLVITAHYDHDGIKNGEIYNGADDNGSGTVALLELAEAFALAKADGHGPRRSILFIALTGEEKGLLGSKYYTDNPAFPMANTVTNLNIDMIGRIDREYKTNGNYLYIIGSDRMSKELHSINEESAKLYTPDLELNYKYNDPKDPENMYSRSDHYHFVTKKVPAIFYFSGLHDDYHTPADDVDKINFDAYEKRARLIFATAWELANREERVKID
jgi:hypothetical protein